MSSFWDRVARLPGLSPVTDYQSEETPWARYVTRLHLLALERGVATGPEHRFLDYGCGVGRITAWLAPRVAEVVGVDTSGPMIEEARRRCVHANVHFAQIAGPGDLPRRDLDGVTLIWVLQHILERSAFEAVLDDLAAALRPGGRVYALDRLSREPVDHDESDYLRLRTRAEYHAAFADRGFDLVQSHAVCVDEQVLGRPGLTARVKRGMALAGPLARLDLSWARRQKNPLMADWFWVWARQ